MNFINGYEIAKTIREELKKEITASRITPALGVLLVGEDPASHLYVSLKEKAAKEIGIATDIRRLNAETTDRELINLIRGWNTDPTIHGILVQLPLPHGHDTDAVIAAMDPKKDADGFHPQTVNALLAGRDAIIPPVHEGILRLIVSTGIALEGARVTILANSDIFSTPLKYLLQSAGAEVTVLFPNQLDLNALQTSQILVTALGRPKFLTRSHLAPHTVVIDVGTSRLLDGKVAGDVDAESVAELPGWLTPVPGGVGPVTIALLLRNVWKLAAGK